MKARGLGKLFYTWCSLLLFLQACVNNVAKELPPLTDQIDTLPGAIMVMSFNVENLFDTEHDEGKNDWTYLPKAKKDSQVIEACKATSLQPWWLEDCLQTDWTEERLKEKMQRLAKVILSQKGGKGPDILILAEIENIKVLERLRQEYLGPASYQPAILIEGPDARGIDTAILTRLSLDGQPTLHPVRVSEDSKKLVKEDARSILQADFKLAGGGRLSAFAVHFPAGYHPTAFREQALETLTELAKQQIGKSDLIVAGGDFNINQSEQYLYRDVAAKDWFISHLDGCSGCTGTYYFPKDRVWNFLDAIMVLKQQASKGLYTWKMEPQSVKVVNDHFFQKKRNGAPLKFVVNEKGEFLGLSDHFPILLEIKAEARASNP